MEAKEAIAAMAAKEAIAAMAAMEATITQPQLVSKQEQEQEQEKQQQQNNLNIVKGKRTKRLRPLSPHPFAITTGSGESSTTSADVQDSTEEEEDMANCLILLAQGQSRESAPKLQVEEGACYKFNSRRYLEASAVGGGSGYGKAGYYVYECKTCSRTFPSFQALGGHRASHKKPKAAAEEKKLHPQNIISDEEESQFKNTNFISLQLSNRGLYSKNNNIKIHECSICGAEFSSGQALGGHMRRHRAPVVVNNVTAATLALAPMGLESDNQEIKKPRNNVLSLDLDLNLPAPEDDHCRESAYSFASKQQQQQQEKQQQQQTPLVFAPALVDCHY